MLLDNCCQQSCVVNWDNTTTYCNLEKGTRQEDPASAYIFMLALEVIFAFIKGNENIEVIEIFKRGCFVHCLWRWFYFFLRDIPSVKELINSFTQFYHFSGLKANTEKCKITSIGSLKRITGQSVVLSALIYQIMQLKY